MGELGFMGMLVPRATAAPRPTTSPYALALEEIAAGDGAVSTIMSVHNSVGCLPVLRLRQRGAEGRAPARHGCAARSSPRSA